MDAQISMQRGTFSWRSTTGVSWLRVASRDLAHKSEFAKFNRRTLRHIDISRNSSPLNPSFHSPVIPPAKVTSTARLELLRPPKSKWETWRSWTVGQSAIQSADKHTFANSDDSWKLVEVGRVVLFSAPSPYENR
jgi:hypothetical protein